MSATRNGHWTTVNGRKVWTTDAPVAADRRRGRWVVVNGRKVWKNATTGGTR